MQYVHLMWRRVKMSNSKIFTDIDEHYVKQKQRMRAAKPTHIIAELESLLNDVKSPYNVDVSRDRLEKTLRDAIAFLKEAV